MGKVLYEVTSLMFENFLRGYTHISPCGLELNYVRPADTAMVFSRLVEENLFYAPSLSVKYDKTSLRVSEAGRVYHPAPAKLGDSVF